jgi:hypothetical protein
MKKVLKSIESTQEHSDTPSDCGKQKGNTMMNHMTYQELQRLFEDLIAMGTPQCNRIAKIVMDEMNDILLQPAKPKN